MKYILSIVAVLMVLTVNLSNADINNGLVAYYPFNANADDESGNANHCAAMGATLTVDRNGNASSAYQFDGVSDYLDCTTTASLNLSTAITVSAWIKPDDTPADWEAIVSRWSGSQHFETFGLYINSVLELAGEIMTEGGNLVRASGQNEIVVSQWQHVAMVYDTSDHSFSLYKNGEQLYRWEGLYYGGHPEMLIGDTNLTIGVVKRDELWHFFDGAIDEVRIYSRALSASDVSQVYQDGLGGDVGTCTSETTSSISQNLDIHIPALEYQGLFGPPMNFWANFEFYGQSPEGEQLWKLKNYGEN